jgi:hypothetical protein
MGVAILDDEATYPMGGARREMQPDRGAEVVEVDMERLDAEPREQRVDRVREARERRPRNRLRAAVAGQVGGDHEAPAREGTNHVPERPRGTGRSVEQEHRRVLPPAGQSNRQ